MQQYFSQICIIYTVLHISNKYFRAYFLESVSVPPTVDRLRTGYNVKSKFLPRVWSTCTVHGTRYNAKSQIVSRVQSARTRVTRDTV